MTHPHLVRSCSVPQLCPMVRCCQHSASEPLSPRGEGRWDAAGVSVRSCWSPWHHTHRHRQGMGHSNITAHVVPRTSQALPNPNGCSCQVRSHLWINYLFWPGLCSLFLALALHCTLMLFNHHHSPHSACPSVGTVLDSGQGHLSACMSEVPCLSSDLAEVSELGEGLKPQRSLC